MTSAGDISFAPAVAGASRHGASHVNRPPVAYFSMEIALDPSMPTYAGGLGVLAGDTVRAAADLDLPLVAVTLLHRRGYFFQALSDGGWQEERPVEWSPDASLEPLNARCTVRVESRDVQVRAWRYTASGVTTSTVPVLLLDTDLDGNEADDRRLTDCLYGGDHRHRLAQEMILGIGGVRILDALGYAPIHRYHMNEGHAALLAFELLHRLARAHGDDGPTAADIEAVRNRCVFTTHTPVPAGHDQFAMDLAERVLGRDQLTSVRHVCCFEGRLNMTWLALNLSAYVNGVARRHGEVSRQLFAPHEVDAISNGVHAATWVSPAMGAVFDRHIRNWREDSFSLRYAHSIPDSEIASAHLAAKRELIAFVNSQAGAAMDLDVLTIGFARRAAQYKRHTLIFRDLERLRRLSRDHGRVQIIMAGKAHPGDDVGRRIIQEIYEAARALAPDVPVVFLHNHDMRLTQLMTAGADLWLNTPRPPQEASGTSGMKAALNGVPSLSVLDGWWIEGCLDGVTGWSIGEEAIPAARSDDEVDRLHAESLYERLEKDIVPMYYTRGAEYTSIMRYAIALNGSFFNSHRMLHEYIVKAYR